jgi:hypothetical protein
LLIELKQKLMQRMEVIEWKKKGKPVPPPHINKQRMLEIYAKSYGLKIMVETGTYYGDMVSSMKNKFEQIYSIELSRDLYELATRRFKRVKNVVLIQGDSEVELGRLMKRINQSALFWLDGHYSAGVTAKGKKVTPVLEELSHIFKSRHRGHVIIIDDARCFGNEPGYPSIREISDFAKSKRPHTKIEVKNDSIIIVPIQ